MVNVARETLDKYGNLAMKVSLAGRARHAEGVLTFRLPASCMPEGVSRGVNTTFRRKAPSPHAIAPRNRWCLDKQ